MHLSYPRLRSFDHAGLRLDRSAYEMAGGEGNPVGIKCPCGSDCFPSRFAWGFRAGVMWAGRVRAGGALIGSKREGGSGLLRQMCSPPGSRSREVVAGRAAPAARRR